MTFPCDSRASRTSEQALTFVESSKNSWQSFSVPPLRGKGPEGRQKSPEARGVEMHFDIFKTHLVHDSISWKRFFASVCLHQNVGEQVGNGSRDQNTVQPLQQGRELERIGASCSDWVGDGVLALDPETCLGQLHWRFVCMYIYVFSFYPTFKGHIPLKLAQRIF